MPDETIRHLLSEVDRGVQEANDRLYPLVYDELRRLAQSQLQHERPGHTLQATALANEAYLRLVDQKQMSARSRAHFLAIAAQAMRRILVDHARRRNSAKRGGDFHRVEMEDILNLPGASPSTSLIDLEAALEKLERDHPEKVRVVEMHFFVGLNHEEIAEVLQVSTRSIERYWQFARAWLFRELGDETSSAR